MSTVKLVSITQSLIDVEPEVAQKMGIDVRKLTTEEHLIFTALNTSESNLKRYLDKHNPINRIFYKDES